MLLLPGSALAEKDRARSATEKAAKKACAVGDFQKGVDLLADLFIESNDPTYVYNQGRCYQQNNKCEQALNRFYEYQRKARDLSESDQAEVQQQITDCETTLGRTAPIVPAVASVAAPTTRGATPSPEQVTSDKAPQPAPLPEAKPGKGLRTAGIVFGVVGLAAVGTGVGLALKAQSLSTQDYNRSRENERASLKTWGLVSYGVGAAALVTGTILYVAGWPSDQTTSVAFLPAPNGASVILNGRF
jgi:hypothetical protein